MTPKRATARWPVKGRPLAFPCSRQRLQAWPPLFMQKYLEHGALCSPPGSDLSPCVGEPWRVLSHFLESLQVLQGDVLVKIPSESLQVTGFLRIPWRAYYGRDHWPHPRVSHSAVLGWGLRWCKASKFQVMLRLLVQGPHSEPLP